MKPVFVIGHKNPDIDSVAAAISYKTYKQSTEEGLYIAAVAGEINEEIQFVLDETDFEAPVVLKDVRTTVEDIMEDRDLIYATSDMSMAEVGNLLRKGELKTIPVLDEKQRFLGLITIGDLAMIFMDNLGGGKDIDKSPEILRRIFDLKVSNIMKTRDLTLFEKDEAIEEARQSMLSTRYRNYPVVDEENRYLGMINRHDLLEMKKKKLILVDHNERQQAVDGVEEAEVLEIVDHHRVGDIQTISPIYFHNEPVGSTCTLVAEKFLNNRIFISTRLAGLMLAGILSDTMVFKSPTTTRKDKLIADSLSEFSGLDSLKWGRKIFENSDHFDKQTDEQLISEDLKEYVSGNSVFAIAQIETINFAKLAERKKGLKESMLKMCQQRNYAFMCLMVTDIMEEGTELIVSGERSALVEQAFGKSPGEENIFLKGVMSRKKQVVPVLYDIMRKSEIL